MAGREVSCGRRSPCAVWTDRAETPDVTGRRCPTPSVSRRLWLSLGWGRLPGSDITAGALALGFACVPGPQLVQTANAPLRARQRPRQDSSFSARAVPGRFGTELPKAQRVTAWARPALPAGGLLPSSWAPLHHHHHPSSRLGGVK